MSIKLTISRIDDTISAYDALKDTLDERKKTLSSAMLTTSMTWLGDASDSWQARMQKVSASLLDPLQTEIVEMRKRLHDLRQQADTLRKQAEGFGSVLGGGGDSGGEVLMLDDGSDGQVISAAARIKEALIQQGSVWSELGRAVSALEWGGVSLPEGLSGRLYSDASKVCDFETSYAQYKNSIADLGKNLSSQLAYLDPSNEEGSMSEVVAGFAAYFNAGGDKTLQGLKDYSVLFAADPVNTATGNFVYQTEEMVIFGSSPLSVVRTYNSQRKDKGDFGIGWSHNFDLALTDEGSFLILACADGAVKSFHRTKEGRYVTKVEIEEVIERDIQGFRYTDVMQTVHFFNEEGLYIGWENTQKEKVTLTYDSKGCLVRAENKQGQFLAFSYDDAKHLSGIVDHTQRRVSYFYEGDCLVGFKNECGDDYHYTYDEAKNLISLINPRNVCMLEQGFDDRARLVWQALACRERVSFSYDDATHSTTVSSEEKGQEIYTSDKLMRTVLHHDAKGKTGFSYTERGLKKTETNRLEVKKRFSYTTEGKLLSLEKPDEGKVRLSYTPEGCIASIEKAGIPLLTFEYDQAKLVGVKDADQGFLHYFYDNNERIRRIENAAKETIEIGYDNGGNTTSVASSGGEKMSYTYDAYGRVTKVGDATGHLLQYAYDALHRPTEIISNQLGAFYLLYDKSGNLTRLSDSGGAAWDFVYNKANDLVHLTYPQGRSVSYHYDKSGNVIEVHDEGKKYSYTYDHAARIVSVCLNNENKVTFSYDPEGRVVMQENASGAKVRFAYDDAGRLVARSNENGYEIKFAYDALSRLVCVFDKEGSLLEYEYDKSGRMTCLKDSSGACRHLSWGLSGTLEQVNDEDGLSVFLKSDARGKTQEVVKQLPNTTAVESYHYDAVGRIDALIDPLGLQTSWEYDAVGHLVSCTKKDGTKERYCYDQKGRISSIDQLKGEKREFSYDVEGLLVEVTQANEKSSITRQKNGLIEAITTPSGSIAFGYTYDKAKRRASRTGKGTKEEYSYDSAGRLSELSCKNACIRYGYDNKGRMKEKRLGKTIVERYEYNEKNLLSAYELISKGETVKSSAFTYDRCGRKVEEQNNEKGKVSYKKYTYDLLGRLIEVRENDEVRAAYTYDVAGNRLSKKTFDAVHTYTYDTCDRLLKEASSEGEIHYFYDECGHLVKREGYQGTYGYSYDESGSLLKAQTPSGEVRFEYDVFGKRSVVKKEGEIEQRTTDPTRDFHNLVNTQGNNERTYLFDVCLSAALNNDSVLYIATDELGSPTHVFDEEGALLEAYEYDEFGCEIHSPSERLIPFGFTGYEYDGSGTLFAQARQYDPSTGRFTSEDMIRGIPVRPSTLNRYVYCTQNPIGLIDRNGREASSGNMVDQLQDFWGKFIYGSEVVSQSQIADTGAYLDTYTHSGGGVFVGKYSKTGDDDSTPTGFSVNLPSISLSSSFFNIELGCSANITYPPEGQWFPEITESISFQYNNNSAATFAYGYNYQGLVLDTSSSLYMPNLIGVYGGVREGVKTNITWNQLGEVGAYAAIFVLVAVLVCDDITGVGGLDDLAIPGLLAGLGANATAVGATASNLVTWVTQAAALMTRSQACSALA